MTATNGFDPTVAKRWMGEALRVHDELDAQKIENMNRCRTIRARLPDIIESAHNAGIPKKAFKLALKEELLKRKIEGIEEDIAALVPDEDDDALSFEMLKEALGGLGDTPLGQAALGNTPKENPKSKARAEKKAKKDADREEKAAANNAALDDIAGDGEEEDIRPAFLRDKGDDAPTSIN